MSAGTIEVLCGRPVSLEVNRTGLWREVMRFDAGSAADEIAMRQAVELLAGIDPHVAFRIVTFGALKSTLLNYSARHGWTQGKP